MTEQILEFAAIKLAPGSSEQDLLSASQVFQTEFLDNQDGFIRRDMVRKGDGTYLDVILWQSRAHADAVFERAQSSEAVGQYFGHMEIDPDNMDAGVEHCALLRSFARG